MVKKRRAHTLGASGTKPGKNKKKSRPKKKMQKANLKWMRVK